jgi:hypothetical protein
VIKKFHVALIKALLHHALQFGFGRMPTSRIDFLANKPALKHLSSCVRMARFDALFL